MSVKLDTYESDILICTEDAENEEIANERGHHYVSMGLVRFFYSYHKITRFKVR